MSNKSSNNKGGCADNRSMHEYSSVQEFLNNLPYVVMILLGSAILIVCFTNSVLGLIISGVYLIYGLMGTLWIIIFLCPYCGYYNTRSCPCGYGRIAAKFREKKESSQFAEKFKKDIPVIVPLWFIPVLAGVFVVIRSFSWPLLVLLIIFALDAFVVLPLYSKKHGCKGCPQRESCPWMAGKNTPL